MTNFTTNMKRGFGVSVIGAALLLQGCEPSVPEYFQEVDVIATQQATTTTQVTTTQACNASTLQWMIGQPAAVIDGIELVGPVRVIPAGQTALGTTDRTRTNFHLDVDNRIAAVTCG